jgi:2-C-methyl-D-erythritol 4-phosphate cytidylyltransferase|uniref:2-C-methyl-D-erythritol 4-phosphate cytidylyltransferase n=1 Tax=candidate division WOR-3 bacterium TaxID=2052148 RepID=A0A7C3URL9_UNCW3
MNYSIILAAGEGRRFGGKKQFYPLRGIPLFLYSVLAFARSPSCSEIVIVTNKNKIRLVEAWLKRKGIKKVRKVVVGGKRRIDSTAEGLKELPKEGIVAIHDAVRPVVKPEIIELGFRYAKKYRAVVFGIPVEDTIKRVRDLRVIETIERENLYRIQTPQFFEINLLRQALTLAYEKGEDATDESQIVERFGYTPYLFLGDKNNIKVTTREDIQLVKLLLK